MAIRVALHHRTEYRYDRLVTLLPQVVRLRPAPHCRTPIVSYALKIEPAGHFLNWQQDPYSNYLARLVFPRPATQFTVDVDLVAEMATINPFDFFLEPEAMHYPFTYETGLARELAPFLETVESGPQLLDLVEGFRQQRGGTIDCLVAVNRRIQQAIRYGIRLDPGIQTCEETLAKQAGSCRDSAWLLVQLLRHLGVAARFVSGYLIQLKTDEKALDGPSGTEKDFTDLHAWAEVFLPGAGWIGLDPTSGLLAGEGHIPLACTADPTDAAPVTGSFQWEGDEKQSKVQSDFRYDMSVTRIHEDPRVTKPYSDEQWQAIFRLGDAIDQELEEHNVRLTMGGEPTFVSIDDKDGAEWNTAALGPTKRQLADTLLRRLWEQFAAGGFLHHGQGKWYPGESLPRWSFSCYWRKDGMPIWRDPSLFASEEAYHFGSADALRFMTELARCLQVDPAHALPGYEDAWYYLWRERQLPGNVDPLQSNLDDEEERRRLARVFDQGLGSIVGYTLPLKRAEDEAAWVAGRWFLRREHLFLAPGDSPMGYRLPLDSLPWEPPEERDTFHEPDPFRPLGELPQTGQTMRGSRHEPVMQTRTAKPSDRQAGRETSVIRTALCVEPRQGRMHVFMPPLRDAEAYLELIHAVETTAAGLRIPVQIEGYLPPFDPRLLHFRITPDPGVIEVNIHPAANWRELVEHTTILYEEARQTRLCTEKFMLDGRHTGTGGGNHVVLGGPTPADSPILRRPDLLRSLIAYWHNHPSLSYLFSSLFVGPTSQAPRVDEARNDSLYEMEIAFDQLEQAQAARSSAPPWLVDRIFRHLLVDVSGNTHRAEFCIDKLYSPESASGRLGLVEFRAFEMPPHSRMSLVQQLLLRGLIMRFWNQPYRQRLARWGVELHDRYLLPHFVQQDFGDVLFELRQEGLPFRDEWFAPHFEFRFPLIGASARQGMVLELRTAMEPWHVLGEENTAGGMARYVDSSVERLQVKVRGMTDSRHTLACNGRPVPLFPTGVNGEYVAGVRYKAWQPASCLHPTIAAHSPLVFDLYDTWMRRAVAGCTYHVAHPGGRSHETFPVNANEAEGRRIARFFELGHTPGTYELREERIRPEAPLTLDLRQVEPGESGEIADETPARGRRSLRASSSNLV